MPNVSVIVPVFNSGVTIERCLAAIRRSGYRDYEVIVSDCGSTDGTVLIAGRYADKVVRAGENVGRKEARAAGIAASGAEVIVNIDSDVVIREDTLSKIHDYLAAHPDVAAVTGLLSKEHPNSDFFSQYKNLYMHYIFSSLPERVSFLYGSLYAIRRKDAEDAVPGIEVADDTAIGQRLVSQGKQIAFLKDLEVVHLKRYSLSSFFANDFRIPFDWAKIFVRFRGWLQIGRNGMGFAHSSLRQLMSVGLAALIFASLIFSVFYHWLALVALILIGPWAFLNYKFLLFLAKEKGFVFSVTAFFVTLLDNVTMAAGIMCGFLASIYDVLVAKRSRCLSF